MKGELDLDNLTLENFMDMARYINHLETELESVKSNALAILAQRDNAMKKLQELQRAIQAAKQGVSTKVSVSSNVDLINPEQYREKKQF